MRRLFCLAAVLTILICIGAAAEGLPKTADIDAADAFRRCAGWQREGSSWSAIDNTAHVALDRIASGDQKGEMANGFCYLYLSVRGDDSLGLTEVVLNVCAFRNEPVSGQGIMFSVCGTRYGYQTTAVRESAGTYQYEHFAIPLDPDGLELVRKLAASGGMVYAYGSGKTFKGTVPADNTLIKPLEMLPDWYDCYSLWEENAACWPENRVTAEIVALEDASEEDYVDSEFNLVDINNKDAVATLQGLLVDNGFLVKKADGKYGPDTVTAVKAAQRNYGFAETGLADLRFMNILSGKEYLPGEDTTMEQCETTGLIPMNYRICRIISAASAIGIEGADSVYAGSDDLVLLIVEGKYTCTAAETQDLALECEAWIEADGIYKYPCSVRCAYPGSTALGTKALPLQTVKVYWITEMPEAVIRARNLRLVYTWFSDESSVILN